MSRWRIRCRRACRIHVAAAAGAEGIKVVRGGTYVCMEGPQFSTLRREHDLQGLGYSVIGMTNLPEAKLAREAEICYATVAMVTDFDCWHPDHDAVTVQDIIKVLTANAEKAQRLVARLAKDFPREHEPCPIGSDRALDTALITAPEARDPELIKKLDAVAGRVLKMKALTAWYALSLGDNRNTISSEKSHVPDVNHHVTPVRDRGHARGFSRAISRAGADHAAGAGGLAHHLLSAGLDRREAGLLQAGRARREDRGLRRVGQDLS